MRHEESKVVDVFLSKGSHTSRSEGMCAMEWASWLAGLQHSDRPVCVSPVLLDFMVSFNDSLDDETRQRLRPYISRTLGTAGDGQDEKRSLMALDWLIRTYTPAFLALAGLTEAADKLRRLATIEGPEQAEEAASEVHTVSYAACQAAYSAAYSAASYADSDAARDAGYAAASKAAYCAASEPGYADVRVAACQAAYSAASAVTYAAARLAAYDVLKSTVELLQVSAFELLDRLIDPGGLHDVKTESEWLEQTRVS